MVRETTNYQCPACNGPLRFDGAAGRLTCDHCDSSFDVATVEAEYAERQTKADALIWAPTDESSSTYTCSSCGAQLVGDGITAISNCPYCGNPVLVPGMLAGSFKPDLVIPFKLDRASAVEALAGYHKGKKFLPKAFKDQNHIQEIQGVYVPFWLYDAHSSGEAWFEAFNTRIFTEGEYRITETDHYDAFRSGSMQFERVPVDGSSKMPDAHMDAIEPYDYGELVPYSVAYLPGFLASRYDEDDITCRGRAEERIAASVEGALNSTVTGYDSVTCTRSSANVQWKEALCALLPVWMLSTIWNDEVFLFAMNGQTGRIVGNLPVSKAKVAAWFFGMFVVMFAVAAGIVFGFDVMGDESFAAQLAWTATVPAVISGFACFLFYQQMKMAVKGSEADSYLLMETFNLQESTDRYRETTRTETRIGKKND